jgi:hypothetical protein
MPSFFSLIAGGYIAERLPTGYQKNAIRRYAAPTRAQLTRLEILIVCSHHCREGVKVFAADAPDRNRQLPACCKDLSLAGDEPPLFADTAAAHRHLPSDYDGVSDAAAIAAETSPTPMFFFFTEIVSPSAGSAAASALRAHR